MVKNNPKLIYVGISLRQRKRALCLWLAHEDLSTYKNDRRGYLLEDILYYLRRKCKRGTYAWRLKHRGQYRRVIESH
jgi:hypothetical protein